MITSEVTADLTRIHDEGGPLFADLCLVIMAVDNNVEGSVLDEGS